MKKAAGASKHRPKKAAKKRLRMPKKAVDLAAVRTDISKIVGSQAKRMTQAVVGEGLKGELAPVKYLFEVSGIYPASEAAMKPEEDSLAHTLLKRLGLPTEPVVCEEDESSEPASESHAELSEQEQGLGEEETHEEQGKAAVH